MARHHPVTDPIGLRQPSKSLSVDSYHTSNLCVGANCCDNILLRLSLPPGFVTPSDLLALMTDRDLIRPQIKGPVGDQGCGLEEGLWRRGVSLSAASSASRLASEESGETSLDSTLRAGRAEDRLQAGSDMKSVG